MYFCSCLNLPSYHRCVGCFAVAHRVSFSIRTLVLLFSVYRTCARLRNNMLSFRLFIAFRIEKSRFHQSHSGICIFKQSYQWNEFKFCWQYFSDAFYSVVHSFIRSMYKFVYTRLRIVFSLSISFSFALSLFFLFVFFFLQPSLVITLRSYASLYLFQHGTFPLVEDLNINISCIVLGIRLFILRIRWITHLVIISIYFLWKYLLRGLLTLCRFLSISALGTQRPDFMWFAQVFYALHWHQLR